MNYTMKMTSWLITFFYLATSGCSSVIDQQTSEGHHNQQIAILKQIRKLNEDGSYTYGYEAGDGSFKVESRDVLGNIKGTFGFVDATGEIKRVSYSSSNGTGFKSTTIFPLQEQISVMQNIPLDNRSTTTKKPHFSSTSTESIQMLSRTRNPTTSPTISTITATTTEKTTKPSFIRSKQRHRFVTNGQQHPLVLQEEEIIDEDSQITRPGDNEKTGNLRNVMFAKRLIEHNLRPITEEFEDKEEKIKISTGNILRRQLQEEATKSAPVIEQEDRVDVYGGALSTSRPLFTTTTPPRVVEKIPELRQHRYKKNYINQNNGPVKFAQDQRIYEQQESKYHQQEDRKTAQQILIRTTTHAPTETRDYIDKNLEPIYDQQHSEGYLRDIPPEGIVVQAQANHLNEASSYPQIPLTKLLLKPEFGKFFLNQPLYSSTTDANIHYITDTPPATQEETAPKISINPSYLTRHRGAYQRQLIYSDSLIEPHRVLLRQFPQQVSSTQDEREYQNVVPDYIYRMNQLALPPEPPNHIAPPLSRRDFQILLRRLLVSQYGIQALNYPKTYLEDALYDQQPYLSYQSAYGTSTPKTEVPYPSETAIPITPMASIILASSTPAYSERLNLRRTHMYSRAINPLYQQNQYEDYSEPKYQKRVYRQKYTQEVPNEVEEILPPQIREALLLRMLQLAINAERPIAMPNTVVMSATVPPIRHPKFGPARNVQILGEDLEEKNVRKKI